jgi:hypothetical protein
MADADGRYAFPHGGADERRRLDLLAARLDPVTKRRVGRLGLAPDVRCLKSAAAAARSRAGCART